MEDKRGRQPEVPFGYESMLTEAQRHRIDASRNFGWTLEFIRRPLFSQPTVVLTDADNNKRWQVTDDGELVPFNDVRGTL